MGVAGSGKTTIGRQLARRLGWEFRDGDDFHPAANVVKMKSGVPLKTRTAFRGSNRFETLSTGHAWTVRMSSLLVRPFGKIIAISWGVA
jgi:carbohydrate kinase (thermoresistant glucokinase family)